jgi:hypothetical protein
LVNTFFFLFDGNCGRHPLSLVLFRFFSSFFGRFFGCHFGPLNSSLGKLDLPSTAF